jgi:hypothetical protein
VAWHLLPAVLLAVKVARKRNTPAKG